MIAESDSTSARASLPHSGCDKSGTKWDQGYFSAAWWAWEVCKAGGTGVSLDLGHSAGNLHDEGAGPEIVSGTIFRRHRPCHTSSQICCLVANHGLTRFDVGSDYNRTAV